MIQVSRLLTLDVTNALAPSLHLVSSLLSIWDTRDDPSPDSSKLVIRKETLFFGKNVVSSGKGNWELEGGLSSRSQAHGRPKR